MLPFAEARRTLKQFFGTDVPRVILHATLRVYVLRLLLISSLGHICALVIFAQHYPLPEWPYLLPVFCGASAVVIIHHVLSVFRIIPVSIDILVALGENILVWYFVRPWVWYFNQYDNSSTIILVICIYLQTSTLMFLFLLRVLALLRRVSEKRFMALVERFDFLSMCPQDSIKLPSRKSRILLVTGRAAWRSDLFKNESRTIMVLRGLSVICIIVILLAFVVTKVILDPIHETGWAPMKVFTSPALPEKLTLESDSSWKIILFLQIDEYMIVDGISDSSDVEGVQLIFRDAVAVKALRSGLPVVDCTLGEPWTQFSTPSALNPSISAIEVTCPNRFAADGEMSRMVADLQDQATADIWPDLLIQVDFSGFERSGQSFDPSNLRGRTVYVDVGLTAKTGAIVSNTVPIPLVPNVHLLGAVQVTVRQQFREDGIASRSLFGDTANFLVARIPYLLPDPSPVNNTEDTASLRLYMQADDSSWRFESDYTEKSIWVGLSAVGGFWTLLNGFFALFFGTSLLRVLFDVKPLSTFGLLHKFKGAQLGEYPAVFDEGKTPPGLIAYLREHFIDLRPVRSDEAFGNTGVQDNDCELGLIRHFDPAESRSLGDLLSKESIVVDRATNV